MGKPSSSKVSSTSGPPQQFLDAYTDVYNQAKGLTGQPYQAYGGPMVAGFTPDQYSAYGTIRNSQGMSQPYFDQAAAYMNSSATPISPYQFDNLDVLPSLGLSYFDWAGQQAQNAAKPIELMDYNIDPYESQYTEDVTNNLATLYNQQNAEQYNSARGNAAAQGAFGGDREAVLSSEMARQQKLAQDPALAQIQQQGFAQAQEEFNKQQAADLQRQLADRQYGLQAGQLGMGIGSGLWGEFNTQQAQDVAAQQASAYLQAQAGQGMASLGLASQNAALSGAQAQLTAGQQQQQLEQQLLNVPYYQFMQQQAYPYQQTGWLSNIATGLGGASGGNSSTTYPGPSTLGQVAGLGTAGLGIAGQLGAFGGGKDSYGSNPNYFGTAEDSALWNGWGDSGMWSADGGAVPHRAPGGAVGLAVPPEFGGAGVPGMESYIPGANGMGSEPASKEGSGLSKMFMQPVTTQTQEGGGGGGGLLGTIGTLAGFATGMPWLGAAAGAVGKVAGIADGGSVPRGTLAGGFADGGQPMRYQSHAAAPLVADLEHVMAPSAFGPASPGSVRPAMNYGPSFDAQGYPGTMNAIPQGTPSPPPLSIPMKNGMLDRAALNPLSAPPSGPAQGPAAPPSLGEMPQSLSVNPPWFDNASGDADGGRVGRFDAGGMVYPDMSHGYIPQTAGSPRSAMMGPPKPPALAQPPQQQSSMSPIASFLQSLKTSGLFGKDESDGGTVQPSATPLQYEEGGEVGAAPESHVQQRALLQQYANLPLEKLREMAMRYPPTTPQGAAISRALQMKQANPGGSLGTGPAGPFGPSGQTYPGTTAARGGMMGLAEGGAPHQFGAIPDESEWERSVLAMTPVQRSLATRPSYGEGEMIPGGRVIANSYSDFNPELQAQMQSNAGQGREADLLRALSAARSYGLAEGGPVPITPQSGDFNIQRILDEMRSSGSPMQVGDAVGASDRMRQQLRARVHPGFKEGGFPESEFDPVAKPYYDPMTGTEVAPLPGNKYDVLTPIKEAAKDIYAPPTTAMPKEAPFTYEAPFTPRRNDVSGVTEQPMGGLDVPPVAVAPLAQVPSYKGKLSRFPDAPPIEWMKQNAPFPTIGRIPEPRGGDLNAPTGNVTNSMPADIDSPDSHGHGSYGPGSPFGQQPEPKVVPYEPAYGGLGGADQFTPNWETRNNNFGGLRKVGVPAAGPEAGGFQSFGSPEAGVAAIAKQLDRYASGAATGKPINTIRGIVSTWAPSSENDTALLIDRAAKVTGFSPDQPLDLKDASVMSKMIEATIRNEQGGKLPVSPAMIAQVSADPGKYVDPSGGGPSGPAGSRTLASGIAPGYRANVPGTGVNVASLGSTAAPAGQQGDLSNPPSFSLRSTDDSKRTMRDMMSSPWMMLTAAGAGMLASRSPYPGVALGEGLQSGLKFAQQGATLENKDDLAQVKMESTANQAKHLTDLASIARDRLGETANQNATKNAMAAENLALRGQGQDLNAQIKLLDLQRKEGELQRRIDKDASDAAAKENLDRTRREIAEIKQPRVIQNYFDDKTQRSGTLIVPFGKEGDPSAQVFYPGSPKVTGELTQQGYAQMVAKAAQGDSLYQSDPEGAAERAQQALAKVGIFPPKSQGANGSAGPPQSKRPQPPPGSPAGTTLAPDNKWYAPNPAGGWYLVH